MKNELIKLANDLDEKGLHEEANQLDSVIKKAQTSEGQSIKQAFIKAMAATLVEDLILVLDSPSPNFSALGIQLENSALSERDKTEVKRVAWANATKRLFSKFI